MRRGRKRCERGVTLIELIIAVTLVAAIIVGLLIAMRTSLLTYQKVDQRLQENRRVMGLDRTLERQIGGVMPVTGDCLAQDGKVRRVAAFNGNSDSLRFVSSYSLAEGARGYPRIVEYQIVPDSRGGVRLLMNERLYTGPASIGPLCANGVFLPVQITPQTVEIAGQLAYGRIAYHDVVPEAPFTGGWLPAWNRPDLPSAVRIEMEPLKPDPAGLPMLTVNVPVRITRQVFASYADAAQ